MKSITFNGIICLHDTPVELWEGNSNLIYLHNKKDPLGLLVHEVAEFKKISFSYFISDTQMSLEDLQESMLKDLLGLSAVCIESRGTSYSELTPDLEWTHENKFFIGGHDMNRELASYVGKWITVCINHVD